MTHLTVFSSIPTAWHLLCHSHSEINMNTAGYVLQWKQNENNQKDEIWHQNKPTVLCLFVSVWDDWEENTLLWILHDAGQQFFCSFFWRKVCPEKNRDDTCCNNVSSCSSFMTLWVSVCCYSLQVTPGTLQCVWCTPVTTKLQSQQNTCNMRWNRVCNMITQWGKTCIH